MRHDPAVIHEARVLRQVPALIEDWLWQELRDRRCLGLKFRRQVPVGGHLVSFFCASRRLVILADGSKHGHNPASKTRLVRAGLRVIHLHDDDLAAGRVNLMLGIVAALNERGA